MVAIALVGLNSPNNLHPRQQLAGRDKPETPRLVIVELFTSEGCSSCPPADELLIELQREQPVPGVLIIPLGEHVDYWNRLGWKDPFSAAQFTQRQQKFARAWGSGQVYTPQMVVNGAIQLVGSDRRKAVQAIARSAKSRKLQMGIKLEQTSPRQSGELNVVVRAWDLPGLGSEIQSLDVFLALTEDNLHSKVSRGENAGRTLTHASVVRHLSLIGKIGEKSTKHFRVKRKLRFNPEWKKPDLKVVAFIQDHEGLRIVGAAATRVLRHPDGE